MKRSYTISSITALKTLPPLDLAQFTISSRTFPSKRKIIESLTELRNRGDQTKLLIHADYIYIVSRYRYLSYQVRQAVLQHIVSLLRYCEQDKNILGIVMHTDFPLKKGFFSDKRSKVLDSYNSSFWDFNLIESIQESDDPLYLSVVKFAEDLVQVYDRIPPVKIYLENTTKNGDSDYGTIHYLTSLLYNNHFLNNIFGVCYDMEHEYAATGNRLLVEDIKFIKDNICDIIVHVNTIPPEVQPGNKKDRHSDTTIFECSYAPESYYMTYTSRLDDIQVPWVREVKEETMYRELYQLDRNGRS